MNKKIIDLIVANPDLPIFAFVDYEVVGGDYGSWIGKINSAEIKEFATVDPYGYYDYTYVFKNDTEDYYEYLVNQKDWEEISDKEAEEKATKIINNLKYKKAIFISVAIPDNL